MAKGKTTYQTAKSPVSGWSGYTYPVQKRNLEAGQKLILSKYDPKARQHVDFTFRDVK